jgi:putative NADPH-quinone reductase
VDRIEVAKLEFPWLKTKEAFEKGPLPPSLETAAAAIKAADHLLIVYPLWLGTMPAILKAFLEQIVRPGLAFQYDGKWGKKLLAGKTARIVVTMGMPTFIYRWYFGAHGLKSLERSILAFCGIKTVAENLFGTIETVSAAKRRKWLAAMYEAGQAGN